MHLAHGVSSVKWDVRIYFIDSSDMRYSLRQMEIFVEVARTESVSHAALALGGPLPVP